MPRDNEGELDAVLKGFFPMHKHESKNLLQNLL